MRIKDKNSESGFTLVEVLVAGTLSCITLACIVQFFLTQLNQYYLIGANNALNENIRIFSKFFEKDTHNSLEFYVFEDLTEALSFTKGSTSVTLPRAGNCVLFVTERGMVDGGRGDLYFVGDQATINNQACYPLYRSTVTFSSSKKIKETASTLSRLVLGYIKTDASTTFVKKFTDGNSKKGIFYTIDHKRFGRNTSAAYPHVAGCRHGMYVGTTFVQPGLHGKVSESALNFCFFSRNPRF